MNTFNQADLSWLENPEIFAVNRLDAFSDHTFYEREPGDLQRPLNGTWKVFVSDHPEGRISEFWKSDFDASNMADIQVPGHLQTQGFLPHHYTNTIYPWDGHDELRPPHISWKHNAVAQYVHDFELSESEIKTFGFNLSFHGVETAMYVWLNGEFVGYAEDSFTPSHFDITPYVRAGSNRLAVEVWQRSSASWLEDQDMWRLMGIFRDVDLLLIPRIHVRDVRIRQKIDLKSDQAVVDIHLKNEVNMNGEISASLWDGNTCLGTLSAAAADSMDFSFDVDDVRLWSPEHPNLYMLRLQVQADGNVLEQVEQPVGFRKFEIEDGIMKLNGSRMQFHGINRHEFDAAHGRALPLETMEWDAAFMKQHNINAVRTSHYPNASAWYRLADEYGIALIDETNLETHGSWQKLGVCEPSWNVPGSLPEWKAAVMDRMQSMYERDKNHPSVLIWSLGNESYGGTNLVAMHDWLHETDPSRPVHYEGTTWCREFEAATDIESRMYAKPHEIEAYLKDSPKKPYISCEYEHAMGSSLGNMQEYMDLEVYPHYQGGFIWDYVDQALKSEDGKDYLYGGDFGDFPNDGNFSGDGILFANRKETPKTPAMKQMYRFVQIDPTSEGVKLTNHYLFASLDEFTFAYEQQLDGKTMLSGTFDVSCKPDESVFVPIDWLKEDQPGIWTKTVMMQLKESTRWADAGYELAWGQIVNDTRNLKEEKAGSAAGPNHAPHTPLETAIGDGNMSVCTENFRYYFQYAKGLVSIQANGQELLNGPVRPDFFRALTDNDEGAGYGLSAGVWMAAGKYARIIDCRPGKDADKAWIDYTYEIPFVNLQALLHYEVQPDGLLDVRLEMELPESAPLLPCFGLRFLLKKPYDQLTYLAKGPEDTYIDREASKTLLFSSSTANEFVPYLRPQECANHTGTWRLDVSNASGTGLTFAARETPLQTSVLAWTPEQLTNAMHPSELPVPYQNVVRILSHMMGVGGDDTWGAPVHERYLIKPGHLWCSFTVRPLMGSK